jgi:hypothetical protein
MSFGGSTASLFLERTRATSQTNRRPTPDSEALVSSDEEHALPHSHLSNTVRRASASRPTSSWLSDIGQPQAQPARKFSLGNFSVGSNGSQPPTPSSETAPRLQGRPNPAIGFQSSIWTSDRKEPPSRLTEVSHSPTSFIQGGDNQAAASPGFGIGVEIPLNPSFKAGQPRAMSFSAGTGQAANDHLNRLRSGITRKNSAGGLGQGLLLSQVREDDDGDINSNDNDSDAGVRLPQAKPEGSYDPKFWQSNVRQRTTSANVLPPRSYLARSQTFSTADLAVDEDDNVPSNDRFHQQTWPQKVGDGLQSRRHSLAVDFPRQSTYSHTSPQDDAVPEQVLQSPAHAQQLGVADNQNPNMMLPNRQESDCEQKTIFPLSFLSCVPFSLRQF